MFEFIRLRDVLKFFGYLGITGMVLVVVLQEVGQEEVVEEEVDLEILVHPEQNLMNFQDLKIEFQKKKNVAEQEH